MIGILAICWLHYDLATSLSFLYLIQISILYRYIGIYSCWLPFIILYVILCDPMLYNIRNRCLVCIRTLIDAKPYNTHCCTWLVNWFCMIMLFIQSSINYGKTFTRGLIDLKQQKLVYIFNPFVIRWCVCGMSMLTYAVHLLKCENFHLKDSTGISKWTN